jgi:hypothetical protein
MGGKYYFLTETFFKSSIKNQINSIYKDRVTKPEKLMEFKGAIRCGDVKLSYKSLTKYQLIKIIELGIIELYLYFD